MGNFVKGLIEMGHANPKTGKEWLRFCKKLDTFSHAPINKKQMERMAPFATNEQLIGQVNRYLLHYFEQQKGFQKKETDWTNYEIVPVWYSMAMLLQTPAPMTAVSTIIQTMIQTEHSDLSIARRLFSLYPTPVYRPILESIEKYYLTVNQKVEAYLWAQQIGLELPNSYNWEFYFTLRALPNPTKVSSTLIDHLMLKVTVYAPKGDGQCFDIELRDKEHRISYWWTDHSENFKLKIAPKKTIILKNRPSLLEFKAFLSEIETVYGFLFDKEFNFSYFSRGIKKKNQVQKWLLGIKAT